MASHRAESPTVQEDTPLLGSTRSDEAQPANEPETQELQASDDESLNRPTAVPRAHRIFYLALVAQVALGIVVITFDMATLALLNYGSSLFGFGEYGIEMAASGLFFTVAVAIVYAVTNLARLKHSGRPLEHGFNIIAFGLAAVFILSWVGRVIMDRIDGYNEYCHNRLDDPHYSYRGTRKQCLAWAPKYAAVSWTWVALTIILCILYISTMIMSLVAVYRSRSSRRTNSLESRWRLPTGQVSIEVAIRWGSPANEAAVNQRSSDEPPAPTTEPPTTEPPTTGDV